MTEPSTYNYRLDLRPLDFFFFGGEITFGNGEEVNYYARTRKYPQQTTLLGVLRHVGYRCPKIGKGQIGGSFSADVETSIGKYGYIKAVSPLFFQVMTKDGAYRDLTLGPIMAGAHAGNSPIAAAGAIQRFTIGGDWEPAYELPDFNPKEWYEQPLLPASDYNALGDIVITKSRIGITKQLDGAERTDGFYKQEVGHLKAGASFSCLVSLDEELATNIDVKQVLPVGGEKALFGVRLSKLGASKTIEDLFPSELWSQCAAPNLYAAVLLSDAYVDREGYEALPFAVTDTVTFRHLTTPPRITNFARLRRHGEKGKDRDDTMRQSRKYSLLRRGSILYAKSPEQLTNLLDLERWQTIGYNHYHLLPPIK